MRTLPSCFGRLRYFSKGLSPSPQASVASIDPVLDILDSSDPYRLTENRNRGNTLPVMAMPHFQMASISHAAYGTLNDENRKFSEQQTSRWLLIVASRLSRASCRRSSNVVAIRKSYRRGHQVQRGPVDSSTLAGQHPGFPHARE
jgi:hypothetical protein